VQGEGLATRGSQYPREVAWTLSSNQPEFFKAIRESHSPVVPPIWVAVLALTTYVGRYLPRYTTTYKWYVPTLPMKVSAYLRFVRLNQITKYGVPIDSFPSPK
jgi:hypothetical protein